MKYFVCIDPFNFGQVVEFFSQERSFVSVEDFTMYFRGRYPDLPFSLTTDRTMFNQCIAMPINIGLIEVLTPWYEYAAQKAFEDCFCELKYPEDYGFKSWWDAYDFVQCNGVTVLNCEDGSGEAQILERYEGEYLPDLLEQKFDLIKDVLLYVKRNKIDLEKLEG